MLVLCLLMGSCNQGGNENTPTPSSSDTAVKVTPVSQPEPLITDKLDTLWIYADSVNKTPKKKMIFSFRFAPMDTITIHGWTFKGGIGRDYSDSANLKLLKGLPTSISYNTGTYFGDLVLTEQQIKDIKQVIANHASQYVLFVPSITRGFLNYEVFVSNDDPLAAGKTKLATSTGAITNPSPPKDR